MLSVTHRLIHALLVCAVCLTLSSPSQLVHAAISPLPAPGLNAYNVEVISHLGGVARAVAVQGNRAYVGTGAEFAVLDISDRFNPRRVGYLVLPGDIRAIALADDHAYLAGSAGMWSVDVSEPANPRAVGSYGQPEVAQDIAIAGDYAYVTYRTGLHILDVSTPAVPDLVGTYAPIGSFDPYFVPQVVAVGQYVYIGRDNLLVLDVSNPSTPRLVYTSPPLNVQDIQIAGTFAYLVSGDGVNGDGGFGYADSKDALRVLDITRPKAPVEVGSLTLSMPDSEVPRHSWLTVAGGRAYVISALDPAAGTPWLRVFDVARPDSLKLLGSIATSYPGFGGAGAAVLGDTVYVGSDSNRLQVVDASNPAQPRVAGAYLAPAQIRRILAAGDRLYLSTASGLQIVDIANPSQPAVVGTYQGAGGALLATTRYIYLFETPASWDQPLNLYTKLHIVDVSQPATPQLISTSNFSLFLLHGTPAISGSLIYLPSENSLQVMDVSNPSKPGLIGNSEDVFDCRSACYSIAVVGSMVYLNTSGGLSAIDVSNPISPRLAGTLTLSGDKARVEAIKADNANLYVSSSHEAFVNGQLSTVRQLHVVDISTPAQPRIARSFEMDETLYEVADNLVYAVSAAGLKVRDLRGSSGMAEVASFQTIPGIDSYAEAGLVLNGGRAWLASMDEGLFGLRYTGLSVEGRVLQANRRPFQGVSVVGSDGQQAASGSDGNFVFTGLAQNTYTLTPTLAGYSFFPPSRTLSLPPNRFDAGFVILPAPVILSVTPGITTSLVYSDTQGLTTRLDLPSEAFTQPLTLTLTPMLADDRDGEVFAGHAFELDVPAAADTEPGVAVPATLTLSYSDLDVAIVTDEAALLLRRWNGTTWEDAAASCDGTSYAHDVAANQLTIELCRGGRYALFGPTLQVRLPALVKAG